MKKKIRYKCFGYISKSWECRWQGCGFCFWSGYCKFKKKVKKKKRNVQNIRYREICVSK